MLHCNPLQGQYRVEFTTQGKPCSHYREPLFSLQGPCIHHRESCIHYREFPVRITTQGNPCNHYREWVCSVHTSEIRAYFLFLSKEYSVVTFYLIQIFYQLLSSKIVLRPSKVLVLRSMSS